MIIPNTKSDSPMKTETPLPDLPSEDRKSTVRAASPPPYYPPSEPSSSSSASPFVLPSVKPSNYISIHEPNHSARGTFVLDPSLNIPSEYLPPLPEGDSEDNRSNLHVRSQNGGVSAEVYLLDKPIIGSRKKVVLNVSSANGSVSCIIHRQGSCPPFHLTSSSRNGSVSVKLPRSFQGSVTAGTKNGRVRMSGAVSAQAMVFSTVKGTQRAYIGDLSIRKDETDDVIVLESQNGSVNISYEDEIPPVGAIKSFFSSLLG